MALTYFASSWRAHDAVGILPRKERSGADPTTYQPTLMNHRRWHRAARLLSVRSGKVVETAVRIGVGEQCARASGLCIGIGGRVGRMRRKGVAPFRQAG